MESLRSSIFILTIEIFNNKKVIITGATGWLGKNAIYQLKKIYGYDFLYDSVIYFIVFK